MGCFNPYHGLSWEGMNIWVPFSINSSQWLHKLIWWEQTLPIFRLTGCTSLLLPAQRWALSSTHTSIVAFLLFSFLLSLTMDTDIGMILYWCHYSPLKTAASRGWKQTAEETAQVTGARDEEAATGNRTASSWCWRWWTSLQQGVFISCYCLKVVGNCLQNYL